MAGSDQSSLLRRKMGRQPAPAAPKGGVLPEVAVMRAAARGAYTASGLKVAMLESSVHEFDGITPLTEAMAEAMLVVPFTAPDGAEGYVALSQDFAQSLIEKATTGKLARQPVEPRRASSIDLLLCRDFLGRFLETWREISQGTDLLDWLEGYEQQDRAVDVDLMTLNSRDAPYRMFRVKVQLDEQRDAEIMAAFPSERHATRQVEATTPTDPGTDWGEVWRDAVLDTHAALDAVLVRTPVPLKEVKSWQAGDILDIPSAALGAVTLGRRGGAVVATARLGQAQGHRALRLNALTKGGSGGAALPADQTSAPSPSSEPTGPQFDANPPALAAQESGVATAPNPAAGAKPPEAPDAAAHDVLP
ncbi:FliM/FliN family flagellar motor switch protein [Tropicimonas sp. S265A]|uniref:FliM/FliN family flagellar motor switch protein n=1 Tax=Tropicimonas sp. S265A TaxID=3415134 RepID=UPI003C7C91B0